MQRSGLSFGAFMYLLVGLILAANRGYLSSLTNLSSIVSALLAILFWPLLLFGINLHLSFGI